jgi:hypothetical protein
VITESGTFLYVIASLISGNGIGFFLFFLTDCFLASGVVAVESKSVSSCAVSCLQLDLNCTVERTSV